MKIKINGAEMLLSERVNQYAKNILGIYNNTKSIQDLELMLDSFKDYNVDSNEDSLIVEIKKIFDLPNFDNGAVHHLIKEQVEKFLIKAYVN